MEKRGLNKKGQLTIFIIFGILIAVGIVAIFLILPEPEFLRARSTRDPNQFIRQCVSEHLLDVLPEFQEAGFYFNPDEVEHFIYQRRKIAYHCYTPEDNKNCINFNSASKIRIQNDLRDKIFDKVNECFSTFKRNNKDYDIEMGDLTLNIEILPGKIEIRTRRDMILSKVEEDPIRLNNFDTSINSPMWDFMSISNQINSFEASRDCNSESSIDLANFRRDYRGYLSITAEIYTSEGTRFFMVKDDYDNELNFGIRSCNKVYV
jgi:hypothetical protein